MKTQLIKRIVATAQPQERPYELRDTTVRGLLLRVQPSGHKAWIIEWSRGKRRTLAPLGHLTRDHAPSPWWQLGCELFTLRFLVNLARSGVWGIGGP